MLAENFLKPSQLGLTKKRRAALVTVLRMLERGEIKHVDIDPIGYECVIGKPTDLQIFNMQVTHAETHCGTAGCIAGWADAVCGTRFTMVEGGICVRMLRTALDRLFCPPIGDKTWSKITTEQAARALRNYLTTGEAMWEEIIA